MQSKLIASAHVKCYVNGKLLGIVTGVSFAIQSAKRPVRTVDSNLVQEFVPTTYSVHGQVSVLRLKAQGGLEGIGLTGFSSTVLLEKYLQIDLVDRTTDKVIFSAYNAVVTDQSWQLQGKAHMSGTFSFEAQTMSNEAA